MTKIENALDDLYDLCFGSTKRSIDPRDRDKALEIFIVLNQNGHNLDLDFIRRYLKVEKNAQSQFVNDALKYAKMVIKGTRKNRPGVLSKNIYQQW